MSGILGNSIDRVFRGAVVDFLQFYIGKYVWPSFNVADSCICVGVFIYILSSLFRPDRKKNNPDSSSYVHYRP
jgi:signal peptidase II